MVAVYEPLHRGTNLFLRDAAHFEQPRFQLFELVLEMSYNSFNRFHGVSRNVP
jgi:hypothetical protein